MPHDAKADRAIWLALWSMDQEGDAYVEDRADHLAPGEVPRCLACWHLEGDCFEPWSPTSNPADAEIVSKRVAWLWNQGYRMCRKPGT